MFHLIACIAIAIDSYAQTDSLALPTGEKITFERAPEKHLVVRGKVSLFTTNFVLTTSETTIVELENLECQALLNRDTAALHKLWIKDFTNQSTGAVIISANPVPFYVSLNRVIQHLTETDNTVMVSGEENSQLLKSEGKPDRIVTKTFSHVWMRKGFEWKLISKISN